MASFSLRDTFTVEAGHWGRGRREADKGPFGFPFPLRNHHLLSWGKDDQCPRVQSLPIQKVKLTFHDGGQTTEGSSYLSITLTQDLPQQQIAVSRMRNTNILLLLEKKSPFLEAYLNSSSLQPSCSHKGKDNQKEAGLQGNRWECCSRELNSKQGTKYIMKETLVKVIALRNGPIIKLNATPAHTPTQPEDTNSTLQVKRMKDTESPMTSIQGNPKSRKKTKFRTLEKFEISGMYTNNRHKTQSTFQPD